jgi:hypothetical protein
MLTQTSIAQDFCKWNSLACGAMRPNPSVNLTRNSVPHLPGMARYAHNALPGKRVTLPRAGYLKR